jgi:DNA repair protein RadC
MSIRNDTADTGEDSPSSGPPVPSAGALRARAVHEGLDRLATPELIALCLGGFEGSARLDAERLCRRLELVDLSRATSDHLRHAYGISAVRSIRLAATFALGRRVADVRRAQRPDLRSPARVHALLSGLLRGLAQETFHVLLLDGKHRLRRHEQVSQGTLTSSLVHPREVFGPAIREGAAALIVVHNHPSGDPEPSAEDLAVTRRLVEVGRILGVPLLDHVVIADAGYVSIRDRIRFEEE